MEEINDIEDFLEYQVEDIIWLRVANNLVPYTELINRDYLINYIKERNQKFCEDNGLCSECRSPLVERVEFEEIWGSKQESERYWCCPRGCC